MQVAILMVQWSTKIVPVCSPIIPSYPRKATRHVSPKIIILYIA